MSESKFDSYYTTSIEEMEWLLRMLKNNPNGFRYKDQEFRYKEIGFLILMYKGGSENGSEKN